MSKKMVLDLASLRVFVEVAKDCNMTRTATTLKMSQPAVSAAIKKIEQVVDTELFSRNTRPLQLTTAGRVLLAHSFEILEQVENLTVFVQHTLRGNKPDLRIGFSDCMSGTLAPYLSPELMKITENLSAYTGPTPKISELLVDKVIDVAIATNPMEDVPDITALPLLKENFLIILPKEKEKGLCKISAMNELSNCIGDLPYLRFKNETFDFIQAERIFRSLHFSQFRRIEVDTYATMFGVIGAGAGWAIVPPLGIYLGKNFFDKISFSKFSIEATRGYFVLFHSNTFKRIAKQILDLSICAFRKQILPRISFECPGLNKYIRLEDCSEKKEA